MSTSLKQGISFSFHDLGLRHPGISNGLSVSLAEAAVVCLQRHHTPPAELVIDKAGTEVEVTASWEAPDERTLRAWANEIDATEYAAYCIALAAVETATGLVAVGRAETGSGADYYLGKPSGRLDDFESCYRLEVSGVDRGAMPEIRARLLRKISQAAGGRSNLPAMASVVGLALKVVMLQSVEEA